MDERSVTSVWAQLWAASSTDGSSDTEWKFSLGRGRGGLRYWHSSVGSASDVQLLSFQRHWLSDLVLVGLSNTDVSKIRFISDLHQGKSTEKVCTEWGRNWRLLDEPSVYYFKARQIHFIFQLLENQVATAYSSVHLTRKTRQSQSGLKGNVSSPQESLEWAIVLFHKCKNASLVLTMLLLPELLSQCFLWLWLVATEPAEDTLDWSSARWMCNISQVELQTWLSIIQCLSCTI